MNRARIVAIIGIVALATLIVIGVLWTVVVPIAIILGALVVGIFAGGMAYGLRRARRSSPFDD